VIELDPPSPLEEIVPTDAIGVATPPAPTVTATEVFGVKLMLDSSTRPPPPPPDEPLATVPPAPPPPTTKTLADETPFGVSQSQLPTPSIRSTVYEVPFTVPFRPSPMNVDRETAQRSDVLKVNGPVPPLELKPVVKASPYVVLTVCVPVKATGAFTRMVKIIRPVAPKPSVTVRVSL
jgi:hypothetical protein